MTNGRTTRQRYGGPPSLPHALASRDKCSTMRRPRGGLPCSGPHEPPRLGSGVLWRPSARAARAGRASAACARIRPCA
eukprot:6560517-Pyramimonas_sp.AAC.1